MQAKLLFLTAYVGSDGAFPAILRMALMLIVGVIVYSLWKNGKLKKLPVIPGTLVTMLIGMFFAVCAFLGSNVILFQIGFSLLAISGFLAFKKAKTKRKGTTPRTYYPSYWVIVLSFYFVISLGLLILLMNVFDEDIEDLANIIICILSLLISVPVVAWYFLPYLVANKKGHQQTRAIYILNIFAGWTIVAWIVALIWAHTIPNEHVHIHEAKTQTEAEKIVQFKELYDAGVISKEEYEAKKKQLLDL